MFASLSTPAYRQAGLRYFDMALFLSDMNTKSILTWIVVIIVVLVGAFLIFKAMGNNAAPVQTQTTQTQTASSTSDQVQGQDVKVGTGPQATPGSVVSVLYVGKLTDGTVFDSSAAHGNKPLSFTLGAQGLIPGFQIGVNGMKVGGERLLAIPPSLGYGGQDVKDANGKVIIPANSTIIFDVQLVSVAAGSSTAATSTKTP
jgi:FKBP-type peptidyl-prolyl cis-trans isomerase FkpA